MDRKILWIVMALAFAGCGDDGNDSTAGLQNHATGNNDTSGANDNASLQTNSGTNASADPNGTTGDGTNQNNATATNGNTASTNNTNNDSTNNDTGATPDNLTTGAASCMEILQCLLVCNTEDHACRQDCEKSGTADAQDQIGAYLGCVDELCADATGVTELTECTLDHCGDAQNACLDG